MLVSVYLPTRNRVGLLERAVRSVLSQTYQELELVVVNDGSSDGTADYLAQVVGKDDRIRALNSCCSRGAPAARNAAIRAATGVFVTGLDDDDEFLPCRLASFVRVWEFLADAGQKPSCLYAQDLLDFGGGRVLETRKPSGLLAGDLFVSNHIGNQAFAPREHFLRAGLFDEKLPAWQDLEMFIRLLREFGRARLVDIPTYRLDHTPRADRISIGSEERLREAFRIVAEKHAGSHIERNQLRLQLFTDVYGVCPRGADYIGLLREGASPRGLLNLLRASWRMQMGRLRIRGAAEHLEKEPA